MAATRPTIDDKEVAALEKSFLAARAIPIMHLVNQFYAPDAKTGAAGDLKAQFPAMTRNEAFERLQNRLLFSLNTADQIVFREHLQKLKAGKNLSSNEHIILGLAYLHEYDPKQEQDADAAFKEFELAVKADGNNEYAHTLLGHGYLDKTGWFKKKYYTEAFACFNKAIEIAPDTLGDAYGFRSRMHELGIGTPKDLARAHDDAKKAVKLTARATVNVYNGQEKDGSRKAYFSNLIALEADPTLYAYYLLDQKTEAATRMYTLSAEQGNARGIYNMANHLKNQRKDATGAARYYCAVIFFPKLTEKHLEAKHFLENEHAGNNTITYYLAVAYNDTNLLDNLLKSAPDTFIYLWKQDYNNPLHPKTKERAIAYISQLEPGKVTSAAACKMFATACAEQNLMGKARAFSLASKVAEAKPGQLTAAKNKELADALSTSSEKPLRDKAKIFELAARAAEADPKQLTAAQNQGLADDLRASSDKSLHEKAKVFELAAEKKRAEEATAKRLADEIAKHLALPKGAAQLSVANAVTAGGVASHRPVSINGQTPDVQAAIPLRNK